MRPLTLARAMWTLFEPIHAVTYFAAPARAAFEAAGLLGFWRGYFAGRAAPLGPVGPAPVVAMFNGFAPAMVARALPSVWDLASPAEAIAARERGASATLGSLVDPGDAAALCDRLVPVLGALEPFGHPLGAANLAVPDPDDAHARLWQACTTLREHRGDGHVAALVGAGLAGPDVVVLRGGLDGDRALYQPARGLTDEQWSSAADRLVARGLLDRDGWATDAGRAAVADVELATDRTATRPWAEIGDTATLDLARALHGLAVACRGLLPDVTPIGDLQVWDLDPSHLVG